MSISLGSVIESGLKEFGLQVLCVVQALALAFFVFKNGQLSWQLDQVNVQLEKRTQELLDADSENLTLSGAIESQNKRVNELATQTLHMRDSGEQATQQAAQREKLLQADIDRLRSNAGRECNVSGLSAHITQEIKPQ